MFHAFNVGQNGMAMPFSNIAAGEIVSQRSRAVTLGLVYALSSCSGFLTSYTAPVGSILPGYPDRGSPIVLLIGWFTVFLEPGCSGLGCLRCVFLGCCAFRLSSLGSDLLTRVEGQNV